MFEFGKVVVPEDELPNGFIPESIVNDCSDGREDRDCSCDIL